MVEERQVPTVASEPLTESPLPLRLLDDFGLFTTEAVDGTEQPRRLDELQDGASIRQSLFLLLCEVLPCKRQHCGAAILCGSSEASLRALLGLQSCPIKSESHQHWSTCFLATAGLVEGLPLQAHGMLLDQTIATASLAEAREAAHTRVNISAVQDWVLDYSDPPAIWVVTSHAWYRCLYHPFACNCLIDDSASDKHHDTCRALCVLPTLGSCEQHKSLQQAESSACRLLSPAAAYAPLFMPAVHKLQLARACAVSLQADRHASFEEAVMGIVGASREAGGRRCAVSASTTACEV